MPCSVIAGTSREKRHHVEAHRESRLTSPCASPPYDRAADRPHPQTARPTGSAFQPWLPPSLTSSHCPGVLSRHGDLAEFFAIAVDHATASRSPSKTPFRPAETHCAAPRRPCPSGLRRFLGLATRPFGSSAAPACRRWADALAGTALFNHQSGVFSRTVPSEPTAPSVPACHSIARGRASSPVPRTSAADVRSRLRTGTRRYAYGVCSLTRRATSRHAAPTPVVGQRRPHAQLRSFSPATGCRTTRSIMRPSARNCANRSRRC